MLFPSQISRTEEDWKIVEAPNGRALVRTTISLSFSRVGLLFPKTARGDVFRCVRYKLWSCGMASHLYARSNQNSQIVVVLYLIVRVSSPRRLSTASQQTPTLDQFGIISLSIFLSNNRRCGLTAASRAQTLVRYALYPCSMSMLPKPKFPYAMYAK